MRVAGGVPEWLKGTGCKPVGFAYVGSNPTPSTKASRMAGGSKGSFRWGVGETKIGSQTLRGIGRGSNAGVAQW